MKVKYIGEDTPAMDKSKVYDVISIERKMCRLMTEISEDYLFSYDVLEIIDDSDIDEVMKRTAERKIAYKASVGAGYDNVVYMHEKNGINIWKSHMYGDEPYEFAQGDVYYYIENGEAHTMTLEEYERL